MENNMQIKLPEWTWEFHGHRCPFKHVGYRMGAIALRELGIEKKDVRVDVALAKAISKSSASSKILSRSAKPTS